LDEDGDPSLRDKDGKGRFKGFHRQFSVEEDPASATLTRDYPEPRITICGPVQTFCSKYDDAAAASGREHRVCRLKI